MTSPADRAAALAPGWLIRDVRRAATRVAEWHEQGLTEELDDH